MRGESYAFCPAGGVAVGCGSSILNPVLSITSERASSMTAVRKSECQHGFQVSDDSELPPYSSAMRTLSEELTPHMLKHYLFPKVICDVRSIGLVNALILIFIRGPRVTAMLCVLTPIWWLLVRRKDSISSALDNDQIQWFIEHALHPKHEKMLMDETFVKLLISQATDSMLDAYRTNKWNYLVAVDLFTKLAIFSQLAVYASNSGDDDTKHTVRSSRELRLRYFKAVNKLSGSREAILFLHDNTPCHCLDRLVIGARKSPPTCTARACDQVMSGGVEYQCLACRKACYCSKRCYQSDWSRREGSHRNFCAMLQRKERYCTCQGRHVTKTRDLGYLLVNALKRCDSCGWYRNLVYEEADHTTKAKAL